jgi:arylsulfatase A-like enzyme
MNLLTHMNWAGDSKIYPEIMDKLGIKPTSNWDKEGFTKEYNRMDALQKANWDGVYRLVNEQFERIYNQGMTEKELMEWRFQRYMQDYLGTIAAVDENVGRVLDYLEAKSLTNNTLIVYTSDQGFYLGEHGWYDKRFVYDESFKTPLLMQWEGHIKPGRVSDAMVQNLDYAQTFLEAAGIPAPSDMQGESMVPLLKGKINGWKRDAVYYHYYEYPAVHMVKRHYAIVTKAYKLIHFYHDIDEWELIDRQKDPLELKNVFHDPNYAHVVKKLKKELVEIRKKYGDSDEISRSIQERYLKAIQKQ